MNRKKKVDIVTSSLDTAVDPNRKSHENPIKRQGSSSSIGTNQSDINAPFKINPLEIEESNNKIYLNEQALDDFND